MSEIKSKVVQAVRNHIAELEQYLDKMNQKPDDNDLWTYTEDLANSIPENFQAEMSKLNDEVQGN